MNPNDNALPEPDDFTAPPNQLTPEQKADQWDKRSEEESVIITDLSLTDCLKQSMPGENATIDEIANICNLWQGVIIREIQKSAILAYRMGVMFLRIRPQYKYGQWEKLFDGDEKKFAGFSLSTVKRYIRLARYYKSEVEIKTKSLTRAYEDAGILTPPDSAADKAWYEVGDALVEKIGFIQKSLTSIYNRRKSAYEDLTTEDYEERDAMLSLLEVELKLNATLKKLRDSILVNERTEIFDKCPDLHEWAAEQIRTNAFAAVNAENMDLLPDGFLTVEEIEHLRAVARVKAVDRFYNSQLPKENTAVIRGRKLHAMTQARKDEENARSGSIPPQW